LKGENVKKSALTIEFEQEKLEAVRYFAEQRDVKLQDELDGFLTKLYEKYVPEATRKYIESKPVSTAVPRKAAKLSATETSKAAE
jgi:hypothetical protein